MTVYCLHKSLESPVFLRLLVCFFTKYFFYLADSQQRYICGLTDVKCIIDT